MEDQSQLAETIMDQVADAIIYADRVGVIIRWNRASTALFGFSAEDALGQSLDLIIPEPRIAIIACRAHSSLEQAGHTSPKSRGLLFKNQHRRFSFVICWNLPRSP